MQKTATLLMEIAGDVAAILGIALCAVARGSAQQSTTLTYTASQIVNAARLSNDYHWEGPGSAMSSGALVMRGGGRMFYGDLDLVDEMAARYAKETAHQQLASKLKTAIISLQAVQTTLTDARSACVAVGHVISEQPDAADAMRELGRVLEALAMAQVLVERGPPA